jgi:hypothetical protein
VGEHCGGVRVNLGLPDGAGTKTTFDAELQSADAGTQ